jgi:hypothetical protein
MNNLLPSVNVQNRGIRIKFKTSSQILREMVFGFACLQELTKKRVMVSDEFGYNSKVEGEVIVTRADAVVNWIRKHSVWPMPMGLACCAIELMASAASQAMIFPDSVWRL